MLPGLLVDLNRVIPKSTFFVSQCAIDQFFELFDAERLELKNLRTRDKRAVHVKERIVGRRSDQPEISSFHIGQKNVLLRFVEMMNLVDKQDRFLLGSAETIRRPRNQATHFGDVAFHAANPDKLGMRNFGDNARERCFAAAGRTGENHGRQAISFDCASQKFSRPENMFLADEFLERARAHARGERCGAVRTGGIGIFLFAEKIVHDQKIRHASASASHLQLSVTLEPA